MARKVVIGIVTNPLARAGQVRAVDESPALDRAVARGWVEVTHTVDGGQAVEHVPPPQEETTAAVDVDFLDSEYPGGTDDLLALDGDESPGWEEVPLFDDE